MTNSFAALTGGEEADPAHARTDDDASVANESAQRNAMAQQPLLVVKTVKFRFASAISCHFVDPVTLHLH